MRSTATWRSMAPLPASGRRSGWCRATRARRSTCMTKSGTAAAGGWTDAGRSRRVGRSDEGARSCETLKDRRHLAAESGEDVLTVQVVGFAQRTFGSILAIDASDPAFGIDDPHEPSAGIEPVADLGERFTGAIVVREHLDRQVGRELEVAG